MQKYKNKKLKNKRKVISLLTKIEILNRLRNNERIIDVSNFYSMNETTTKRKTKTKTQLEKV